MADAADAHPFLNRKPPDWIASVPIEAPEHIFIDVGEGKMVPVDMLEGALLLEVDSGIGSFSIRPELVERFVEFTERTEWRNLPTEPTSVWREAADRWKFRVGGVEIYLSRAEIEAAVASYES